MIVIMIVILNYLKLPQTGEVHILTQVPVVKLTFKDLKNLEREPLRHCEVDGKLTFTRHFLMLGKVTFDEQVNVL